MNNTDNSKCFFSCVWNQCDSNLCVSVQRYQENLPTLISSRPDKHISLSELVKLMEWKLTVSEVWTPVCNNPMEFKHTLTQKASPVSQHLALSVSLSISVLFCREGSSGRVCSSWWRPTARILWRNVPERPSPSCLMCRQRSQSSAPWKELAQPQLQVSTASVFCFWTETQSGFLQQMDKRIDSSLCSLWKHKSTTLSLSLENSVYSDWDPLLSV